MNRNNERNKCNSVQNIKIKIKNIYIIKRFKHQCTNVIYDMPFRINMPRMARNWQEADAFLSSVFVCKVLRAKI